MAEFPYAAISHGLVPQGAYAGMLPHSIAKNLCALQRGANDLLASLVRWVECSRISASFSASLIVRSFVPDQGISGNTRITSSMNKGEKTARIGWDSWIFLSAAVGEGNLFKAHASHNLLLNEERKCIFAIGCTIHLMICFWLWGSRSAIARFRVVDLKN